MDHALIENKKNTNIVEIIHLIIINKNVPNAKMTRKGEMNMYVLSVVAVCSSLTVQYTTTYML